jgi:hypothetical protein
MKLFSITAATIAALLLAGTGAYIWSQDGRVWIHAESAGVCLTKPHYRSWAIRYSHGRQVQNDGTCKNLWKRPTFHHADFAKFLKEGGTNVIVMETITLDFSK